MKYTKEDYSEMSNDFALMLEAAKIHYSVKEYRKLKGSWARICKIIDRDSNREGNK
ncbi:MAG TPA: hypothetical protein VFD03_06145 [Clostridia bacterium]|nr:hypothetical protein [Clostridia bacterium]